jgi:ribonuclease P/MRP protein subunit RPP1
MFADIVFPKDNEEEFLRIAERLGYSAIVFAYEGKVPDLSKLKASITVYAYGKFGDLKLAKSTGDDRAVMEKKDVDLIYGLEEAQKKDFMHHRASGLNQVLCAIAKKQGIIIGFSLSSLIHSSGMVRAQIMGRMMQNIRFCRKYKLLAAFCSFASSPYQMRAPLDMVALAESIGMSPGEARNALKSVAEKIRKNVNARKTGIRSEGIEIV